MRKNLAVLMLAAPSAAFAQDKPANLGAWLYDYFISGASVTAGFGAHRADITVRDKASNTSGTLSDRDNTAWFLSYSTRPSFIGASQWGYNFMLSYTTFNADLQQVAKDTYRDLGTRLHGRVASVVPTLFYQWGRHGRNAAYFRTGVGLGLGVTKYQGDIILNYPANTTPVSVSSDHYDLKIAGSLYLEGRYRNFGITVSAAGPSYEDDRYHYGVTDVSTYLSYTYYF